MIEVKLREEKLSLTEKTRPLPDSIWRHASFIFMFGGHIKHEKDKMMNRLILCAAIGALLTACDSVPSTSQKPSVNSVAMGQSKIPASFSPDLIEKMKTHKLPGFSLAIIDNYEVVYSEQWGVKATTSEVAVNGSTAFSTASMSKPVTALLSVILEEKGLIDLNDPINDYLVRWKIPNNEFTTAMPVTWTHLLSHTSGATQFSGFADFYEGDKIPTLVESLEGKLPRYNGVPLDFVFTPGSDWRYSGGGYTILQMALEDHFQKPLHILAQDYIFGPLGMVNTTMIQPNEAGFLTDVASVHDSKGDVIRSGIPITPQVAPSGMWSTPQDMAKLAIAMQKALRGDTDSAISSKTAHKLTNIISLKSSSGHSLFGPRSFGFDNIDWMILGGSNTGVGGEILASMERGRGVIFFGNGDRANRTPVFTYVRGRVLDMMNWEQPYNGEIVTNIPRELIKAATGPYKDFFYGENLTMNIVEESGKLYLESPIFEYFLGEKRSEMIYLGDNIFKVVDYPNKLQFNLNEQAKLVSISLLRGNSDRLTETLLLEDIKVK